MLSAANLAKGGLMDSLEGLPAYTQARYNAFYGSKHRKAPTLPKAAFMDSLAGLPAYTPLQKGSMSRSNTSAPRLRRTYCSTLSS